MPALAPRPCTLPGCRGPIGVPPEFRGACLRPAAVCTSGLRPACLTSEAQGPTPRLPSPHTPADPRGGTTSSHKLDQTHRGTEGPRVTKGTERIKVEGGEEPAGEPDGRCLGYRQQGVTVRHCPQTGQRPLSTLHTAPPARPAPPPSPLRLRWCPFSQVELQVRVTWWGSLFTPVKVTIHH